MLERVTRAPRIRRRQQKQKRKSHVMGFFDSIFGRGSADAKLMDQIFNLKYTAKTLARAAKKCESEEKANKTKVRA